MRDAAGETIVDVRKLWQNPLSLRVIEVLRKKITNLSAIMPLSKIIVVHFFAGEKFLL